MFDRVWRRAVQGPDGAYKEWYFACSSSFSRTISSPEAAQASVTLRAPIRKYTAEYFDWREVVPARGVVFIGTRMQLNIRKHTPFFQLFKEKR